MNGVNNLIFDLDGTLIDSSAGIVEAVNYALSQNGQPQKPADLICKYIGYPLQSMFADFSNVPYEALLKPFRIKAKDTMASSSTSLAGADDALKLLSAQGYRMAIATTKIKSLLDAIIEKLGWSTYFEVTIGGDQVDKVKPEPDIFILAMQQLQANSDECLVIGDTVNDILGARAAGMEVVAVTSPFGVAAETSAAAPDYCIDAISDLPDLLTEYNRRAS